MYIDSRELPDGHRVEADICIIGAGPAGITIANSLAATNLQICLIESGGFDADNATQSLYKGSISGLQYTPLHAARTRYFGGTTSLWSGWCRPLDPVDFEQRSWVAHSGWPFGIETLQPYYRKAEPLFGLPEIGFTKSNWASDAYPVLPFGTDDVETTMFRFTAPARFGEIFREPLGSAENVRTYLHANVTRIAADRDGRKINEVQVRCLSGNRFSVNARRYVLATGGIENARLLLSSDDIFPTGIGNERGLLGRYFMDHPGVASGLIMFNDPGQRLGLYTGDARRVSLLSKIDGGSMEQYLSAVEKDTILDWAGRGAAEAEYNDIIAPVLERRCVTCHNPENIAFSRTLQHYDEVMRLIPQQGEGEAGGKNRDAEAALRLSRQTLERHRLLNYCAFLEESRGWSEVVGDDGFWSSVGNVAANFGVLTGAAYRRMFDRDARRRLLRIVNIIEATPNPDSRVTLTDDRDALGMRRVNLDWRLHENDKRTIVKAQEILAAELGRAGLGRAMREFDDSESGWPDDLTHGWHHMGTTRMHIDPNQGVVDSNCRVHGVANLYVAGSSVFPTYGISQPTYTIVAMALRLADHLQSIVD
jgi:choline dehydrogenase-like flavoprotein